MNNLIPKTDEATRKLQKSSKRAMKECLKMILDLPIPELQSTSNLRKFLEKSGIPLTEHTIRMALGVKMTMEALTTQNPNWTKLVLETAGETLAKDKIEISTNGNSTVQIVKIPDNQRDITVDVEFEHENTNEDNIVNELQDSQDTQDTQDKNSSDVDIDS